MKSIAVLGLILALGLRGCSCEVKINEKNETDMGSHHVVIKPGATFTTSSSSSGGNGKTFRYRCGETSVTIENTALIVNNRHYGQLDPGVDILIDNGVVFVGGEKREGKRMTKEEIMDAAPVKETVEELDGYTVTVCPGSSFTSTSRVFGKHTLTAGKTKVTIKNDELFVNGTPYGSLMEGDTILVEQNSVSVSGEPRKPRK